MLQRKAEIKQRLPIDAFVLIIKFENNVGTYFAKSVQQIIRIFGKPSLNSFILLCILGDKQTRYSDVDFEKMLRKDEGFVFLKQANEGRDIPFCLWDNKIPYPSQIENLIRCLETCKKIGETEFAYIFQMVETECKNKEKILDLESRIEENIPKKEPPCTIL